MAYDEYLAERIDRVLEHKQITFLAKKMMGGLCYMVDDKMCCGLLQDKTSGRSMLMARVGEGQYEQSLSKEGCTIMNFTGREMKGYVFVTEDALDTDDQLEFWVQLCIDFNPLAKSSKKK